MTDNELIAVFMGAMFHRLNDGFKDNEIYYFAPGNHPNPHCNAATYKRADELEYQKRWDQLMPVIERITHHVYEVVDVDDGVMQYKENVYAFPRTFGTIGGDGNFMFRFNRGQLHIAPTFIGAAHIAVVAWIKDYNEGLYS